MWLIILILFILVIVLYYKVAALSERLEFLEGTQSATSRGECQGKSCKSPDIDSPETAFAPLDLHAFQQPAVTAQEAVSAPVSSKSGVPQPYSIPLATNPEMSRQSGESGFNPFTWLFDNFLIKIGAVLVFIGVAWFVTYAIAQGWITVGMLSVIGIGVGLVVALWGERRIRTERLQGLVVHVLGAGIVLISLYVLDQSYAVTMISLVGVVLTIANTVRVAVTNDSQPVAVAAAIAALLVPYAVGIECAFELLIYSLTVTSVLLTVATLERWYGLLITLGVASQVVLLTALDLTPNEVLVAVCAIVNAVVVFIAAYGCARQVTMPDSRAFVMQVAAMISLWLWSSAFLERSEHILVLFVAALAMVVSALWLYQQRSWTHMYVHIALAYALLLVLTAELFSGATATFVYALEIGLALATVLYLQAPARVANVISVSFVIPVFLSLEAIFSDAWERSVVHSDALVVWTILAVSALVAVTASWRTQFERGAWFLGIALIYALISSGLTIASLIGTSSEFLSAVLAIVYTMVALVVLQLVRQVPAPIYRLQTVLVLGVAVLLALGSIGADAWSEQAIHLHLVAWLVLLGAGVWLRLSTPSFSQAIRTFGVSVLALFAYLLPLQYIFGLVDAEYASLLVAIVYALYFNVLAYGVSRHRLPEGALAAGGIAVIAMTVLILSASVWIDTAVITIMSMVAIMILVTLACAQLRHVATLRTWYLCSLSAVVVYGVITVWRGTHALLPDGVAVAVALLSFTLAGVSAYVFGRSRARHEFRVVGVALLGVVLARLLLVDVWKFDLLWRFVTFIGIGGLFMAGSFIERQLFRSFASPNERSSESAN